MKSFFASATDIYVMFSLVSQVLWIISWSCSFILSPYHYCIMFVSCLYLTPDAGSSSRPCGLLTSKFPSYKAVYTHHHHHPLIEDLSKRQPSIFNGGSFRGLPTSKFPPTRRTHPTTTTPTLWLKINLRINRASYGGPFRGFLTGKFPFYWAHYTYQLILIEALSWRQLNM